ncbi:intercellular trafficking and secretion, partial [Conoideocrella luteorostrata]
MAAADQDHDQDNFSSVSWTEHADDPDAGPIPRSGGRGGHSAVEASGAGKSIDAPDPHGLGSEQLDCTVGSPLKENDGSKDAFISYLITTH